MKYLSKIILFLIANVLGFITAPLCILLSAKLGIFSKPDFDTGAFKTYFITGTYLTWFACAVFSFSYFFLRGKERLLFLWAPVVIPTSYGLYVIFSRFSS